MQNVKLFFLGLLLIGIVCVCHADDDDDSNVGEQANKFFEETLGQSMKGFGDFFRGVADNVKEKSEDGADLLKTFSEGAQDKSKEAADSMKGFGDSLGDRFNEAREKLTETGEKIKEALGDAAENTRKGFEGAASEISNQAKSAGDTLMKMFG